MIKIIGLIVALLLVPSTVSLVKKNEEANVEIESSQPGVIETPVILFSSNSSTTVDPGTEGTDQETENTEQGSIDDGSVELSRIPLSELEGG